MISEISISNLPEIALEQVMSYLSYDEISRNRLQLRNLVLCSTMNEDDPLDCLLSIAARAIENDDVATSAVHAGDTDSSDDEDNRDFENRKYNQFGRDIKHLLDEADRPRDCDKKQMQDNAWKSKRTQSTTNGEFIFDIRVVNPLVSNSLLQGRMVGREIVPIKCIKMFTRVVAPDKDWVVAGVIVGKSGTKTSQKGKNYCIWTLSDLKADLKTVSVFLFAGAHKELWKTSVGTVVGILNPTVMEPRENSKDEVCLSIVNHQLAMVIGESKDLGTCKSLKKNGEQCTAFVNTSVCEYCLYHVRREYGRCSKRSDLQSSFAGEGLTALRNKVLGKDQIFYAGKLYTSIPAKKNPKHAVKDRDRLNALAGLSDQAPKLAAGAVIQKRAVQLELPANQRRRDLDRLRQLGSISNVEASKLNRNDSSARPSLSSGENSYIDLSAPIPRKEMVRARQKASAWIRSNGPIKKADPNDVRGTGKARTKRTLETAPLPDAKKNKTRDNEFFSERFKKMMAATSGHVDLLERRDDEERQKYFDKLETRERLEAKMMSTYKMPCKAVRCSRCKYTNFSASDLCKAERHPLKVFDAVKRFFRCGNCGNRTVCLTVVPSGACKNCGGGKWERTGMMNEKKAEIGAPKLSIRGGEQEFVNSVATDANLNLMVPDE